MLIKTDLSDQAYAALRERILTGVLRPGQRLSTVDLAQELGVSRTPVTLALDRLAREGLVKIVPRVGAFVTQLSARDVSDVYEARLYLEPQAAVDGLSRMTAEDMAGLRRLVDEMAGMCQGDDIVQYFPFIAKDQEFHRRLVASTGNSRLLVLYDALNAHVQGVRVHYLSGIRNAGLVCASHEAIMSALEHGDPAAVRQAVYDHIVGIKESMLAAYAARANTPVAAGPHTVAPDATLRSEQP